MEGLNKRHTYEVADVLRLCHHDLEAKYTLHPVQRHAMQNLTSCRTQALGGHVSRCNQCGNEQVSYNSCRNRHCPKCQYIKQEQWVDKLSGRLIPGRYFHMVFTVPERLNSLFLLNQGKSYNLLFHSAWKALSQAGWNKNFLGAEVGAVAILHTWGQTLSYHPHIHMVVPAGGLSEDGLEWISSSRKFFVPVKALSVMFRGILIRELMQSIDESRLKVPTEIVDLDAFKQELYSKSWHVYAKKAFGGLASVLSYLGHYTHRVAITNSRIVSIEDSKVCFRYRNYRTGKQNLIMQLEAIEFARRFLQHILPSGYYKIRYFGILASVHIHSKREQAISLVGKVMYLPQLEGLNAYEVMRHLTNNDPAQCPVCKKGLMTRTGILPRLE